MIDVDDTTHSIVIPDLGVTMRTMLAAAAAGMERTNRRSWNIRYKEVVIGRVRVKNFNMKGPNHDGDGTGA